MLKLTIKGPKEVVVDGEWDQEVLSMGIATLLRLARGLADGDEEKADLIESEVMADAMSAKMKMTDL
jgi:hypothetical protein